MESLSRSLIGKIDLPSSINTFVISHLWINEKLSSLSLLWTSVSPCVKTPLVPHGDDSEGRASMVNVWRLHSSLGPISWFPIFLCISAYAKVPQISLLKGHMQVNEDFFFLMHFSALSLSLSLWLWKQREAEWSAKKNLHMSFGGCSKAKRVVFYFTLKVTWNK